MKRRSGLYIMGRLIKELKPLIPVMMVTITMGVLGFLAAISITSFATLALGALIEGPTIIDFKTAIIIMVIAAVSRGLLRYVEQLSGHYIAFKILLILRDKVFSALRRLAPAKLEGKDKGNLISLITSDIELLEVFYAHTIAPIAIAMITNLIITIILYQIHFLFGVLAFVYFVIIGFIIPYFSSRQSKVAGVEYREVFGESNSYILDSLRGLKEVILFNQGNVRLKELNNKSKKLNESLSRIKNHEALISGTTDVIILMAILSFVGIGFYLYAIGTLSLTVVLVSIVIIASSFGPVVALSHLANNLLQTFACAERVFNILDETPVVDEVAGEMELELQELAFDSVTFAYPNQEDTIFEQTSVNIQKGEKIAIIGKSGIGKSTFIKLLMRYFDTNKGTVSINDIKINSIPTSTLRRKQTLMSQETYLFNDSIEANIRIGKPQATFEEVVVAAKKASIHEFIETLPNGYQTIVGELGGCVSSGEKQRLGLARAFLHNGDILILDEPTSNLDALNEGAILKSISEYGSDKTLVLISHRRSTTAICEDIYKLENKKIVSVK
ncbi:MAG TPA: thiol reductant ABC exporter subunit CydC [Firmicutes bacterium]|nr:thiol reductant ABC exporter subunit CydC [Bacillota bacterium]